MPVYKRPPRWALKPVVTPAPKVNSFCSMVRASPPKLLALVLTELTERLGPKNKAHALATFPHRVQADFRLNMDDLGVAGVAVGF